MSGSVTDALSGVDPNSGAFAAVDEYGTVQPNGPVSVGSGEATRSPLCFRRRVMETTRTDDTTRSP